jgi:hypothetical protein
MPACRVCKLYGISSSHCRTRNRIFWYWQTPLSLVPCSCHGWSWSGVGFLLCLAFPVLVKTLSKEEMSRSNLNPSATVTVARLCPSIYLPGLWEETYPATSKISTTITTAYTQQPKVFQCCYRSRRPAKPLALPHFSMLVLVSSGVPLLLGSHDLSYCNLSLLLACATSFAVKFLDVPDKLPWSPRTQPGCWFR